MSNYPDGIDGSADSFNQPDPWTGRTCGECGCIADCTMKDGTETSVCRSSLFDVYEVSPDDAACEAFEAPRMATRR